ncbi:MAG: hypothetical protein WAV74_08930, partial [Anaerolineae bacterium]
RQGLAQEIEQFVRKIHTLLRMNSGRRGVPPQSRPAPTGTASTQVDARRNARQARFQSLSLGRPAPTEIASTQVDARRYAL